MSLVKPRHSEVTVENPPLVLAVAQVQYDPILAVADAAFVSGFQTAIRERFPRLSRVASLEVVVGPDGIAGKPSDSSGWAFETDGGARVLLDPNSLTLESRSYETFDVFAESFEWLLARLVETVGPQARTRLGLRYVNQLRFDDLVDVDRWRSVVRPEVLGLIATDELADAETIKHTLSEVRIANVDSQLIIRCGFLMGGVGVDGKAIESPFLLLDLDHFDVRRMPTVDRASIMAQLTAFHADIESAFVWALSDEGTKRLGVREFRG